jgi:hypothetical protein
MWQNSSLGTLCRYTPNILTGLRLNIWQPQNLRDTFNLLKDTVCTCKYTQENTPQNSYYTYLGKRNLTKFFKTCCTISVLFSTKCHWFHNCIFFRSNNTQVCVNHALKFKYWLQWDEYCNCNVSTCIYILTSYMVVYFHPLL